MNLNILNRPILASVISVIIVLLGLISLQNLPMTLYPNVTPPEVNVTVEYTGANAEAVIKAAIVPLERAINGVPGMKYMSSDAGNDGTGVVQILFATGTDPDVAAINVQNRVNSVLDELPAEVLKNGVKIAKEENAMLMYLDVFSTDTAHDEKFLYNFADINLLAELKRINGVGYADILGAREYAMRIWLKPDKMLSYNISAEEVIEALKEQNLEAAPGKIGESSDKEGQALQFTINYTGKFNRAEQYRNLPIKADASGEILRIRDIADVEFGTNYFDVESKINGRPSAAIVLKQLPGSNANEVIANVKAKVEELKQTNFLEGMDYVVSYDVSRFLDASVHEVVKTLIEAFILVALVVFLFLQDTRSTIIPILAVPVSLIGTLFVMSLLGYSLNLITLFALVLAIGIVVDDAIVVVEAVHAKMEETGLRPAQATKLAMKEISGAILAITLVMTAVFLPTAFLEGPTGIFYSRFSLTMAAAIVLSGLVALTLTPALCVLILKPHHPSNNGFFAAFNKGYNRIEDKYRRIINYIINRKTITYAVLVLFSVLSGLFAQFLPKGFIPNEDQGTFYASITTPSGATLERTKSIVNAIQIEGKNLRAVESISTLAGSNILSDGTGATYGTVLVNLKPWDKRDETVEAVIDSLQRKTEHIKGARIEFFPPPPIPGYGNAGGFELRLLDKTGRDNLSEMNKVVSNFINELNNSPLIASAFTIFDATYPQYTAKIDVDKAAQKGITAANAMGALQTLLGSEYATNFIRFGQMYKVMVQALPGYRAQPSDLLKFTVKNNQGELVPLSTFMSIEKTYGVDQITRYNMFPSAEINGEGKPGIGSGEVIEEVQKIANEKLPKGYSIDWAGISRDEVMAGNEALLVFLICLVFVYLILAGQYESLLLPLPVVLSLPFGVFGSFLFLSVLGLENNIYAQIALIMLIGLLGKNAILIVEFAALKEKEGLSPAMAAIAGASARLRPILMTSFAFIAGLTPLMFSSGAGAIGNRTIGSAAAGGMLIGTIFGVLIVPSLYVIFSTLGNRLKGKLNSGEIPLTEI